MQNIDDIEKNLRELVDRMKASQDFEITDDFLLDGEWVTKTVSQVELQDVWNKEAGEKLWIELARHGSEYIKKHQGSKKEFEHNLEKVILEMGKVKLIFDTLKHRMNVKPEKKPEKSDYGGGGG